jgi:hypothetical protein
LANEDSLLDFLCGLAFDSQTLLMRYVRSEYLSCEKMEIFLGFLFSHSNVDPLSWLSLSGRLLLPVWVDQVDFPLKEANSLDGIISYLTKKHGGNVHEKGIVTITSKSVRGPSDAPKNVADLTSGTLSCSKSGEPGQWICWDFHEVRVRPTHYTLWAWQLKSWVVEGSLDGENWTEIDRETNNQDFEGCWSKVSFTVSKPVESRFIRLTQTDKNYFGNYGLPLCAVEFFGI